MSVNLTRLPACPPWCDYTAKGHLEDVQDLEGLLIHGGGSGHVRWSTSFDTVLGAVDADDPARVFVNIEPDLSVDEARALIRDLQAALAAIGQAIGHE